MTGETPPLTVYFDGSCPLCRAEIRHYRAEAGAESLDFVDVSRPEVVVPGDLTRQRAMARFHVRTGDGSLVSGAAAFVTVWRRLPRWRWAAWLADLPGMMAVLETGYRVFLPARPALARLLGARGRKAGGGRETPR
jgi:predicted DCC family thiol-disulfide oxidoreductase YuxK